MPEKRGHSLLEALLGVVAVRKTFAEAYARLKRQLGWLVTLDQLLTLPDPFHPSPALAEEVRRKVQAYLDELNRMNLDETDRTVVQHIIHTFHNRWWGLFACYEVEGLPRTNNDLEIFLRHLKTGQRRITGRKAVNDFILRYGSYAAFVDLAESHEQLFARLCQVSDDAFLKERAALRLVEARLKLQCRFHHDRDNLLSELEQRWGEAIMASHPADGSQNL
jgi:hypothetical protein